MNNEYTCAMCGGVFEKTWTDDEALAECEGNFGKVDLADCSTVCDDCYQLIRPADHPGEVEAAIAALRSKMVRENESF